MPKDDILRRLGRVEGQVRGINRMVTEDRYCIDVLDQIAAVTRALEQVSLGLLHSHLRHCVIEALADDAMDASERIDEATESIARLLKS